MPALTFKERDDQMAELRKQSQMGNTPDFNRSTAGAMGYMNEPRPVPYAQSPAAPAGTPTPSFPTSPQINQNQIDRMWRTFNNSSAFGRDRRMAANMIQNLYGLQNQQALEGMRGVNQLANTGLGGQYQLANTGLAGRNQWTNTDLTGWNQRQNTGLENAGRLDQLTLMGQTARDVEGIRGQNQLNYKQALPDPYTMDRGIAADQIARQNAETQARNVDYTAGRGMQDLLTDPNRMMSWNPQDAASARATTAKMLGYPDIPPPATQAIPSASTAGTRPMGAGGSGRAMPPRQAAPEGAAAPTPAAQNLPAAAQQMPAPEAPFAGYNPDYWQTEATGEAAYFPGYGGNLGAPAMPPSGGAKFLPRQPSQQEHVDAIFASSMPLSQKAEALYALGREDLVPPALRRTQDEQARASGNSGIAAWSGQRYAEGGMVGQALWQDPTQGFGQPPSIQSLDPMVREYAQYVSTAVQNNLQPLGFGKFMDLLASARQKMQQLPTMGYQAGFADGGMVDQPWYMKLLPGYSNPYVNGPAPMAPPAQPATRDQAVQMLGSGLAGNAANAIRGHQSRVEETMREIRGYAGGGAIPVAGKQVLGPGTATSDSIPAVIDGQQPAALSSGEFVFPTDVTQYWGTAKLQSMIDKARQNG